MRETERKRLAKLMILFAFIGTVIFLIPDVPTYIQGLISSFQERPLQTIGLTILFGVVLVGVLEIINEIRGYEIWELRSYGR